MDPALWSQPISRNVFGLLERFGDAELAALVAPRPLIIEAAVGPGQGAGVEDRDRTDVGVAPLGIEAQERRVLCGQPLVAAGSHRDPM